jgi:hypothetical protein
VKELLRPVKVIQALKERSKSYSELSAAEKNHFLEPLLSWKSPLYPTTQKTKGWYIGLFTVTGLLALYAIVTNAWSFAVVIVVAAGVYYYLNEQEVPIVDVAISDIGFLIGTRVFNFGDVKTFWLDYRPPFHKELHLILKNEYRQDIIISIHGMNPSELRRILTRYLPEWEEREKTFTENITHFLGL